MENKLFIFKKDRNNPLSIQDHIKNVKTFIDMLGLSPEEQKTRLEIFCKYFDEEIMLEVKCEPGYEHDKASLEYLEGLLIKMLDVKHSKIKRAMEIWELAQFKGESIVDFSKRIRVKCIELHECKEEFMLESFMHGMTNQRMARTLNISG